VCGQTGQDMVIKSVRKLEKLKVLSMDNKWFM